MSIKLPDQVFGTWVGQLYDNNQNEIASIFWSLSLTTSVKYPSAYGASLQKDLIATPITFPLQDTDVNILQGTWTHATKTIDIKETLLNTQTVRQFTGKLIQDSATTWVSGDWKLENEDTFGKFVVRLEEDNPQSHISGQWLGEAAPDISLRDFYIPTNPIRWCISFMKPPTKNNEEGNSNNDKSDDGNEDWIVFGVGFFDDSADVMGRPLLFYSLYGSWDHKNNKFTLTKDYERLSNKPYTNFYTGSVNFPHLNHQEEGEHKKSENGEKQTHISTESPYLSGEWKNPEAGSFGFFKCIMQSKDILNSTSIFICSHCQAMLRPGEVRYSCEECKTPWACCQTCYDNIRLDETQEHYHLHKLISEVIFQADAADGNNTAELIRNALKMFHDKPLFGIRPDVTWNDGDDHKIDRLLPAFEWVSYGSVSAAIVQYISALRKNHPLRSTQINEKERVFAAFCGDITPSYIVTMISSLLMGHIIVPIHGALDTQTISTILLRTSPSILIVEEKYLQKFNDMLCNNININDDNNNNNNNEIANPNLIVVIKPGLYDLSTRVDNTPLPAIPECSVKRFEQIVHEGESVADSLNISDLAIHGLSPNEISAILYTSGSTGAPKGAMFTEELVMPSEGITAIHPFVRLDYQPFDPTYVLSILSTLQCGGCRVLASMETLMDDFLSTRPTHFGATPIFWNSLYQDFTSKVDTRMQKARSLLSSPPSSSSSSSPSSSSLEKIRSEIESEVGKEIRASLGNRLYVATCGGAPISPAVLSFIKNILHIDIVDLYGSRESGGISRDGFIYPGVDVLIRSVPELNYFAEHDPPQGEILVASPRLIGGYWNDDDLNAKAFEMIDGKLYYHTGDVGELTFIDGKRHIRIIDRSSSFIKLAQGEWISPSKIELILEQLPWVDQALVLASSLHRFPVAVIIPSRELHEFWDIQSSISADNSSSSSSSIADLTTKLLSQLRLFGLHHFLKPIEIPQAIYIEGSLQWSDENGFLTSTLKKKRNTLAAHYLSIRDHLYSSLSSSSSSHNQNDITSPSSQMIISDDDDDFQRLRSILKRVFPGSQESGFRDLNATFAEIGGDSLSAARLLQILREEFGVRLRVDLLYEYPLSHIAKLHSFSSLSLPSTRQFDWSNELQLVDNLPSPPHLPISSSRDILCTGVTGFMGPLLLAEIVKSSMMSSSSEEEKNVTIHVVVRGSDVETAKSRLKNDLGNACVAKEVIGWVDEHVRVHCGDIGKHQFGLDDAVWNEMIGSVRMIYHSGARVNMTMPYSALRDTNVISTLQLITFAYAAKAKIVFVSSIGAIPALHPADDSERYFKPESNQLAQKSGYAQSKVISEWLLHRAAELYNLDVCVIRPAAICGCSENGYSNVLDIGNILISVITQLKCYPLSPTLRFQWIPVDFVAKATVVLGQSSVGVYNLIGSGPHLQEIIEVMKDRGYNFRSVGQNGWGDVVEDVAKESNGYVVKDIIKNMVYAPSDNNLGPNNCKKAQQELLNHSITWPKVTKNEINSYLNYFVNIKFVNA